MQSPPSSAYEKLESFLAAELSLGEFETWVYAASELEEELGAPAYVELLAFDYRQAHADLALAGLVRSIHERGRPGLLLRDRAYRYACGLLSGAVPLPRAVHGLANLWYQGYEGEWPDFVGISSEFDDYPDPAEYAQWEPGALAKYLEGWAERKGSLEEAARASARELLKTEFRDWAAGRGAAANASPLPVLDGREVQPPPGECA